MTHSNTTQMALPLGNNRRRLPAANGFARALAIVVRAGKQAEMESRAQACCPHCGHKGPIETDFGFRLMKGQKKAQSWCRACRSARARAQNQLDMALH